MKKFEILNSIRKMNKASQELRVISKDKNLSFDKSKEIQQEQDRVYKKLSFYKGLLNAMEKEEKWILKYSTKIKK